MYYKQLYFYFWGTCDSKITQIQYTPKLNYKLMTTITYSKKYFIFFGSMAVNILHYCDKVTIKKRFTQYLSRRYI